MLTPIGPIAYCDCAGFVLPTLPMIQPGLCESPAGIGASAPPQALT